MEFHELLTVLLTVLFLMLGGAYIIYIYDAYRRTRQVFLLSLSVGFFLLITGGALAVLIYTLTAANQAFNGIGHRV